MCCVDSLAKESIDEVIVKRVFDKINEKVRGKKRSTRETGKGAEVQPLTMIGIK